MPASPLILIGGAAPLLLVLWLVQLLVVGLIVSVPSPKALQSDKMREPIVVWADTGLTPMAVACLLSGVALFVVLDLIEDGGNEDRLEKEEDGKEEGRLVLGV